MKSNTLNDEISTRFNEVVTKLKKEKQEGPDRMTLMVELATMRKRCEEYITKTEKLTSENKSLQASLKELENLIATRENQLSDLIDLLDKK